MFLKDLMNGEYDSRSDGSCAVVDLSIPSANWKSQLSTLRIVVSVPCGVGGQFGIASQVGGFVFVGQDGNRSCVMGGIWDACV